MITHFYIDNFKSLVNFELDLAKFTCLIGLNGAGKSTVLQALDFVSAIMSGEVDSWLEKRNWSIHDLKSNLTSTNRIQIRITFIVNNKEYQWQAAFSTTRKRCVDERLGKSLFRNNKKSAKPKPRSLLKVQNNKYQFRQSFEYDLPTAESIRFRYTGSILSQLEPSVLGELLTSLKNGLSSLRSLDLLSPYMLRQKSRKTDKNDIGMGGEQLSVFIHQLPQSAKNQLLEQLKSYYPQVTEIHTKALRAGWVQLEIVEGFNNQDVTTEARHVNDGMLRMLAILAQQFSPLETLLFDEIENGINPEVIEKVVDALVASPKQIIVTTHSPMLLNYMTDAVAKQAVMLIYKNKDGATHATRFFDMPSAAQKLESLPPGSAMLDVYLDQVAQEAEHRHAA